MVNKLTPHDYHILIALSGGVDNGDNGKLL